MQSAYTITYSFVTGKEFSGRISDAPAMDVIISKDKTMTQPKTPMTAEEILLERRLHWTSMRMSSPMSVDDRLKCADLEAMEIYAARSRPISKERLVEMFDDAIYRLKLSNDSRREFGAACIGALKDAILSELGAKPENEEG